jgi:hypothetical protein
MTHIIGTSYGNANCAHGDRPVVPVPSIGIGSSSINAQVDGGYDVGTVHSDVQADGSRCRGKSRGAEAESLHSTWSLLPCECLLPPGPRLTLRSRPQLEPIGLI